MPKRGREAGVVGVTHECRTNIGEQGAGVVEGSRRQGQIVVHAGELPRAYAPASEGSG